MIGEVITSKRIDTREKLETRTWMSKLENSTNPAMLAIPGIRDA
jgi:hypothetical protein